MFVPNLLMDEPTRHFSIIHGIHQIVSANDITASIDVRLGTVLHCMAVDVDLPLVISNQGLYGSLGVLGTKCTDDEISLHVYGFASQLVFSSLD